MTLLQQTQALRAQLRIWAASPDWDMLVRYELLPQKPSSVWHQRLSQRVGRLLRVWGLSRSRYYAQKWLPSLKHAKGLQTGTPLLLWGDVHDQQSVREACTGMQQLLLAYPALLPVLVTGVADFAFYSRLGWLVEYLPDLPGEGASYLEKKQRYLAWRYRDALALPLSAGLASQTEFAMLLQTGEK